MTDHQVPSLPSWSDAVTTELVLGHPCLVFEQRPHHLRELLDGANGFGDREFLVQGERRLTFADHESAVARVAAVLAEAGVGAGDRVLLLGSNSIEWVVAFWAIAARDAVVVLGNAWWSAAEVAHAVAVAQPALVLADAQRLPMAAEVSKARALDDLLTSQSVGAPSEPGPSDEVFDEDRPAVVLFTSGTTGLPKGAILSHRCLIATLQSLLVRTRRLPNSSDPPPAPSRALLSLPLFHIGGLQQIITPFATGGTVVFTEGRFDAAHVIALLERERINVWSAVPTMVAKVLDHVATTGRAPLLGVRTVGIGGSPVHETLRNRVQEGFPNAARGVAVTYGLSEACGVVATGAGDEILRRPGTVGRPLSLSTIRIDEPDESGAGEILLRSPSVMLGYLGVAADDQPITPDRWLRTGDVGRIDGDGFLYVTDRSKDIVIRGGENIATSHVEARLAEHPAVAESAVVGLPHAVLGEELAAVVVLRPGSTATPDELARFAGEHLAYFEVPSQWRIDTEELPKNSTGKVQKRAVRDTWIDDLQHRDKEESWDVSTVESRS